MEEGTSSIDGTPCTQRLSLREFQKCIARHVYTTGNEFHTLKFDGFQDIIKHIDGHEAYEIPTYDDLNGWILKEIGKEMEAYVAEIKNSWKSTGCSILLDGWIDGNGRNLMSVLVGSPKGTLYLKSADISSSDSQNLQKLFEEVLVDVGVENVVQVISHSTSPIMKEIGKNLVDKYRSFFWTVSGSYCIELMLEKFASMDLVGDVLEKAKMITRFVHGHESVLKLLRDQTSIHCLVKPSINRSAVPFLTLQNTLLEKAALDELFKSSVLKSSNWASKEEGKKIVKLVADCSFWEQVLFVLKAAIPLVNVLEWMNGDDDHLGNIYETIDQAKETIREQLKDTTLDHIPFWEVIDDIWNKCLHSPLHATGYFLNPCLFYTEDFSSHPEVTVGLLSCSVLMSKDHGSLHGLSMQFDEYQRGSGAFQQGSSDLSNISPVSWWLKYGEQYPELQRLAVRILGQKCSGASKYQLQRSMAERLLSGSGNGNQMIRRRQAKKLAFIHYNLHLQKFKSDVANKISIHEMKGIDDWTGRWLGNAFKCSPQDQAYRRENTCRRLLFNAADSGSPLRSVKINKLFLEIMPPSGGESLSIEMNRIIEYFPRSFLDYAPNSESKFCIQRVGNQFRMGNQQDYEPEIIAIGPYHRGKDNLKKMERQKFYYLKSLLERKGEDVLKLYFEAVRQIQDEAKKSYAELLDQLTQDDFVAMLVVDGCFIVELLIKFDKCIRSLGTEFDTNDEIFQNEWIVNSLQRDLLLFDNQIPFCVLSKLFEMIDPEKDFIRLAKRFFNGILPGIGYPARYEGDELEKTIHLLGLIHNNWLPNFAVQERTASYLRDLTLIRSVTELRENGVRFEEAVERMADDRIGLLSIKFRADGTLEIPHLRIEERTECFFRNLIAYEQHYMHIGDRYITSYAKFLGCLIKSPRDVQILRHHRIIDTMLSDEAVAQIFNKIIGPVTDPEDHFHYIAVVSEVNAYCSRKRNKWKAMLWHKHLHSPWGFISVAAGCLFLVMTLVQTIYAVASYYKTSN